MLIPEACDDDAEPTQRNTMGRTGSLFLRGKPGGSSLTGGEPVNATEPPHTDTVRRIAQLSVLFFTWFLVAKTIAIEPFGVPTGSMAPSFYGNHRRLDCLRCGFPVVVGEPSADARPVEFERSSCPNCNQTSDLSQARIIPGDRLLVDKSVYSARSPRRWEVSVFRCPSDDDKPYVKRVVGLPGETIRIAGGDVYANGELLRKSLAQFHEVRIPVFDLNFAPPQGWGSRWLVEPLAGSPKLPKTPRGLPTAADDTILHDGGLHLDALAKPDGLGLTYRHLNLDEDREESIDDRLGYNGRPPDRKLFAKPPGGPTGDPVHDFAVSFDLEVLAGVGTFAVRLTDGAESFKVDLPLAGNAEFAGATLTPEGGRPPAAAAGSFLEVGKIVRVEVAIIDRTVFLILDGKAVVAPIELPADAPEAIRKRQTSRPVQFGARSASVVVRNLCIDRDIHYLNASRNSAGWSLSPDEYFLLGDNTAGSHDSRLWTIDDRPAPGIPERLFLGKPFLIHQPMKPTTWTINGRSGVIQSPDWNRLRWMR